MDGSIPQYNGIVERKNRTIMGLVRSMPKRSLSLKLWGEAMNIHVYFKHRFLSKALKLLIMRSGRGENQM